jgi:hypothetical protein
MDIHDFKKGDAVYMMTGIYGGRQTVHKVVVKSVGRKYVTIHIDPYDERRFEDAGKGSFLEEVVSFGEGAYLFRAEEDCEDYLEKRRLQKWLFSDYGARRHNYSLEQLRKVRDILDPDGEYRDEYEC